jgi:lysophospholipase L1-like esterase
VACLVFLIAFPGVVVPASAASSQFFRVVVLGSSTAVGSAAYPLENSWVRKYDRYLGSLFASHEVINLAVGGYTTFNIMPTGFAPPSPWDLTKYHPAPGHNITKALQLQPDLIIVNLPSNDCADFVPVDRQVANYDRVVEEANTAGVPIWIGTSQPRLLGPTGRALLRQMCDAIFSRYRAIDFWYGLADGNGCILPEYDADGVHLNNAGHQVLFERVVSTVRLPLPLQLSTTELDFGEVSVGDTRSRAIVLSNDGTSTITVDWMSTGTFSFAVNSNGVVLGPGESQTVEVTFAPASYGPHSDVLSIHNDSSVPDLQVALSGLAPAPTVAVSHSQLGFPPVRKGGVIGQDVVLYNRGTGPLEVALFYTRTRHFRVSTPAPAYVQTGDSLTFEILFAPDTTGHIQDTVLVVTNGGVETVVVYGLSPAPVLVSSAPALEFGSVSTGTTHWRSLTLRLSTLIDSVRVRIDSVRLNKGGFVLTGPALPATLTPRDSLVLRVGFSPVRQVVYRDTLRVFKNTLYSVVHVPLNGTGSAPATAVPAAAELPDRAVLFQNYPNPFNPSTTIRYAVPSDPLSSGGNPAPCRVKLAVYDMLGREVAVVVDGFVMPGSYSVEFTTRDSSLPSGAYYCRLIAGNASDVTRMILLR